MKNIRVLLVFIFLILLNSSAFANQIISGGEYYDEVLLESEQVLQSVDVSKDIALDNVEKSLKEKLRDVYHLEIDRYEKPNFLLKEILTKNFDSSLVERSHLWGAYNGDIGLHFVEDSMSSEHTTNHYDINAINLGYDIFLKDNLGDMRIMLNYNPLSERNVVQNLFADIYIANNRIPHHRLLVGNSRPPVGYEGAMGPYVLPFIARSQIARNFGTVRKLGARVTGNYPNINYDLGVYSSDTYFQEFFPGAEFVGWVNVEPLSSKLNKKYGKIKIGTGIDAGNRNNTFCVTGAYLGYELGRFTADFEWAHANGYNGPTGFSSERHASGFYTTLAYMLTSKLQLLARYDEFDPNTHISNNHKREYSAGLNYYIKGQGLKMMLNYVFVQNESLKDSHRVMLGSQILL